MPQTDPLARAWATTEGVVTLGLGAAVSVLSGVDPSALPHKYAAGVAGALSITLTLQRGWVKTAAIRAKLGPDPLKYLETELLDEVKSAPVTPVVPPVA